MIRLKSKEEIRILREGGRRLAAILSHLAAMLKPGVDTADLEALALKMIKETGGRPAFKDYPMGRGIFFPSALCVSINDEVVHGASLPSRLIKSGDIVDLDIGMEWPVEARLRAEFKAPFNQFSSQGGFFTDTCVTVGVGKVSAEAKKLLRVTKECLAEAIALARPGNNLLDIARAVERRALKHGYGVVRDLVGHGLGYFAHEEPDVLNFVPNQRSEADLVLEPGLVIAIEPMINLGSWEVKSAANAYTVVSADGSISAHFEHSVAITEEGPLILTR